MFRNHELRLGLQVYLDETDQNHSNSTNVTQTQSRMHSQISVSSLPGNQAGSADSLVTSRSPSESSIPLPHVATAPSSLPSDDHEQDFYEPAPGESEAPVGTCVALYDFDGEWTFRC